MSCHSIADGMCILANTLRCDENASHKMKINNIKAVNDNSDPIEEITFHFIKASG
jgi:hypothetical protein